MFEGQFLERTVRGAFAKTMRESGDAVKVQFDHGHDTAVGSRVLAYPDDLREDADSAVLEGDLFDTSYNRDLLPGLKAGAYGSSFRFQVIKDEWNDDPRPSDTTRRACPSGPSPRSASSRPVRSCSRRTPRRPPQACGP
jgi:HK97 family phage prohead protease